MFLKNFDLTNKTALITGAGGLLGFEHASALLEINCNLILTDINLNQLIKVKEKLKKTFTNKSIHIFNMDVTSKQSLLVIKKSLEKLEIELDILINNAALNPKVDKNLKIANSSRLETYKIEDWNQEIAVGLTGAFLCSQVFGSAMARSKKKGCIINISSDLSVIAPDQRIYKKESLLPENQTVKPVTYSVIKSGLIGLTKYLATYWIENNIRCNSLSPGGIYTNQPKEFVSKLTDLIPLGRMARKDEYRSAIQFLCSDASAYLNGHNLVMDGGRSIW